MHGQWIGRVQDEQPGLIMLDLDDNGTLWSGSGFFFPDDQSLPATYAPIHVPTEDRHFRVEDVSLVPIDREGNAILSASELERIFPGVQHAQTASITIDFNEDDRSATVRVDTSLGLTLHAAIIRSDAERPSDLVAIEDISSWANFKAATAAFEPERFIFRGQNSLRRLRTTFHRTKRSDLLRYINADAPLLLQTITPLAGHFFDIRNSVQVGSLYNLAQHHGYPTPLLDWTFSPFIAAFFAFRTEPKSEKVRIFIFDRSEWYHLKQYEKLVNVPPHLSILETIGISNPRLLPQQALSTLTNVDDIEEYVRKIEGVIGKTYLRAIDLPASERISVLTDLRRMGITAAALFPGLDGACEALRGRTFGY